MWVKKENLRPRIIVLFSIFDTLVFEVAAPCRAKQSGQNQVSEETPSFIFNQIRCFNL
jgi:hypothetical protein